MPNGATGDDFIRFLTDSCRLLSKYSKSGSVHYVFMDWADRRASATGREIYAEMKNIAVWIKSAAVWGHSIAPSLSFPTPATKFNLLEMKEI